MNICVELDLGGEDLEEVSVEFSVFGSYYPATMVDPAEYPEVEILNVINFDDVEVYYDLTNEQINYIVDKCHDYLEDY